MPSLNINATQWLSTNIIEYSIASSAWDYERNKEKSRNWEREEREGGREEGRESEGCWRYVFPTKIASTTCSICFDDRLPVSRNTYIYLRFWRIYSSHETRLRTLRSVPDMRSQTCALLENILIAILRFHDTLLLIFRCTTYYVSSNREYFLLALFRTIAVSYFRLLRYVYLQCVSRIIDWIFWWRKNFLDTSIRKIFIYHFSLYFLIFPS